MIARQSFAESTTLSVLFPPPLRGRVRDGGKPQAPGLETPLSSSPPQGGREQALLAVRLRPNSGAFA
jgi:hypothetical protein